MLFYKYWYSGWSICVNRNFRQTFNLKDIMFNCISGFWMSHDNHIYVVQWETNQGCVQNLKHSAYCRYMEVSITNVWDKHQQRVFWDFYWTANLKNKYCYRVWSSVVTYLYVKSDKWHVTCSVYWNWLQWNRK